MSNRKGELYGVGEEYKRGELYRGRSGGEKPSEDLEHTLGMEDGTFYEYYEDAESGDGANRLTVSIVNAKEEANMDLMPDFQGTTTSTELFDHTPARLQYWGSTDPWFLDRGRKVIEKDIAKNQGSITLHPEDVPLRHETGAGLSAAEERNYMRGLASRGTWQHVPIQDPAIANPQLWKLFNKTSSLSQQQFFDEELPGMESY